MAGEGLVRVGGLLARKSCLLVQNLLNFIIYIYIYIYYISPVTVLSRKVNCTMQGFGGLCAGPGRHGRALHRLRDGEAGGRQGDRADHHAGYTAETVHLGVRQTDATNKTITITKRKRQTDATHKN